MRDTWGPYCPIPQRMLPNYVHVVYPTSWGVIEDSDGMLHWMTDEELDEMAAVHGDLLARSFQVEGGR